jgi:hypothetical protein
MMAPKEAPEAGRARTPFAPRLPLVSAAAKGLAALPTRSLLCVIVINSAVKTRSTQKPRSRNDGVAVSEMFTREVKIQLGL